MTKQELTGLKSLLNRQLQELTERKLPYQTATVQSVPDVSDQATIEVESDFRVRLAGRQTARVREMETALARIANGTYSICDSCGEEIGSKRLKANPTTTLCVDCKSSVEFRQKAESLSSKY